MDTLSAVLGDIGHGSIGAGADPRNPFQKSWLLKPATLLSMFFSAVFVSLALCFVWYGIIDERPPIKILSAVVSSAEPEKERLGVTVTYKQTRFCHGKLFGFIHDRYSFGVDPIEIPPENFDGPTPSDGIVTWTFPVDVKDYFWKDKDGFTMRFEFRLACNSLQGSLFPRINVSTPDVVIPHS